MEFDIEKKMKMKNQKQLELEKPILQLLLFFLYYIILDSFLILYIILCYFYILPYWTGFVKVKQLKIKFKQEPVQFILQYYSSMQYYYKDGF